jgi:hydroxyacylglutathione hydrolase
MGNFYTDEEIKIFKSVCGPLGNNTYLIVDPSANEGVVIDAPADPEELLIDLSGTVVKAILLTHNHRDHWAGLQQITSNCGAPFGIHNEDSIGLPKQPDFIVKDEWKIKLGNLEVVAIYTPGHTDGSVSYKINNFLFTGDTLFPGGPGRSRSPGALRQVIDSITSKLYQYSDDTIVLPGHGLPTTLGLSKEEYKVFSEKHNSAELYGDVLWVADN